MNKLSILLIASAFTLAACNSPNEEQDPAAMAETAGEQAVATEAADDAAMAGTDADVVAGTEATDDAMVAADAAADSMQSAYEEGQADAAEAIDTAADDMQDEQAVEPEPEIQD